MPMSDPPCTILEGMVVRPTVSGSLTQSQLKAKLEDRKAAYAFYFHDDDWQNDGDCTKIWDYMTHHYLSLEEDTASSFLA